MKKRVLALSLMLILLFSVSAHAASPRLLGFVPSLAFDGTTANCSIAVYGDSNSDEISVVLKLWNGSKCVETWTADSKGVLFLNESAEVVKGQHYTLTADVTINDYTFDRTSTSAKCP